MSSYSAERRQQFFSRSPWLAKACEMLSWLSDPLEPHLAKQIICALFLLSGISWNLRLVNLAWYSASFHVVFGGGWVAGIPFSTLYRRPVQCPCQALWANCCSLATCWPLTTCAARQACVCRAGIQKNVHVERTLRFLRCFRKRPSGEHLASHCPICLSTVCF